MELSTPGRQADGISFDLTGAPPDGVIHHDGVQHVPILTNQA